MTEAPYHRVTRAQVNLEIVKAERDTLVLCHCPYCEDLIIGWVIPGQHRDKTNIKLKTKCEHFDFFTPGLFYESWAVFNPPAPF